MSHYTITGEFISDKKNNIKEDFSISDVTNTISSYFTLDGNFFSNKGLSISRKTKSATCVAARLGFCGNDWWR